ncbi:30S ribosomal protein S4 [Pendulispora albinea]|uniref:Small ribosomal subunit protein uS4 n=1 Tax=Pendulispora albinea TaxID=2741071 RepID=A0ABZ2M3K5_9BACT
MSRYTGPRVKIMRKLGTELPGLSPKKTERRPYPPGQHGQARKKLSEYAVRLMEKQKVRMNYGVSERQLRHLMHEAKTTSGNTGPKLIELLERRLDNVVFRAGFARTIPSARQLVNHGHILVNGKRVDIASYRVLKGDVVTVRDRKKVVAQVEAAFPIADSFQTPWLEVDRTKRQATVSTLPDEGAVLFPLRVQLVVEFYSQKM